MAASKKSKVRSSRNSRGMTGPTSGMNELSFGLVIKTSNTAPQQYMFLGRFEEPDSTILGISHSPITRYNRTRQEHEELTTDELKQPGFWGDTMTMKTKWKDPYGTVVATTRKTFTTKKGYFTKKEVAANIVKFEKKDRPKTKWFDGIDAHHVFFKGLHRNPRGSTYSVFWES